MYLRERVVKFREVLFYINVFLSAKISLGKVAFCSAYLLLAQTHSLYPQEECSRIMLGLPLRMVLGTDCCSTSALSIPCTMEVGTCMSAASLSEGFALPALVTAITGHGQPLA